MATTATSTTSPPTLSPSPKPPTLPPLVTTTNTYTPRRTSSQRAPSFANKRMSSYSITSKPSVHPESRPASHVFPIFHSSLPYTLVRDFAYPASHPFHYGPPPHDSNLSTPVSEHRRQSDPAHATWEDARGNWSATPPWISDTQSQTQRQPQTRDSANAREQLPAMSFSDGGPPYSEDEDLQSPVVTTARHKKQKSMSGFERGRSPGAAGPNRGAVVGPNTEVGNHDSDSNSGPGGALSSEASEQYPYHPLHRDSNFAKPLQRERATADIPERLSEDGHSEADFDGDDIRFSKDYSFTIASPDEEMHGKAVALFDFESEHQNELPLKEGQIILVSYRHGQGWLVAEDPRTGESGLVPEEFVRLVRDIEGGLNGLGAVDIGDSDDNDMLSPTSLEPSSEVTPRPSSHEFPRNSAGPVNGGSVSEKHPPVQSSFSTSSKDLAPYPLPRRSEDTNGPNVPELPSRETEKAMSSSVREG